MVTRDMVMKAVRRWLRSNSEYGTRYKDLADADWRVEHIRYINNGEKMNFTVKCTREPLTKVDKVMIDMRLNSLTVVATYGQKKIYVART